MECRKAGDDLRCLRCHEIKPEDDFSRDRGRAGGRFPWCKSCQNEYHVGRKTQDSDLPLNGHLCALCDTEIRGHAHRRYCSSYCRQRVASLKKVFGLSVEDYRSLLADAGGVCPICKNTVVRWHVDHNHRTGEVTGVVCDSCNVGALSRTFHDVSFVKSLLAYLEDPPSRRLGIGAVVDETKIKDSNLHKMWGALRQPTREAGIASPPMV